ncbi:hypothetical protein [Caballeronia sp. KNU42]
MTPGDLELMEGGFACSVDGLSYLTRYLARYPQLPVILATGYAHGDVSKDREEGYAALGKPFQIGDMARTVKAALTRPQVCRLRPRVSLNAVAMSRPS